MSSEFDLKEYLLSEFSNNKYKTISLMELFASDQKYYQALVKKNLIEDDATAFFKKNKKSVMDAGEIPSKEFRVFQYRMIIDEYLKELSSASRQPIVEPKPNNGHDNSEVTNKSGGSRTEGSNEQDKDYSDYFVELRCLNDDTLLQLENVKNATLKSTGEKIIFPLYRCPKCRHGYTSINNCKDQVVLKHNGEFVNNLLPEENRRRHQMRIQNQQEVLRKNSWRNEVKLRLNLYPKNMPGECKHCHYRDFLKTQVYFLTKNGKISGYPVTVCKVCKTCYIKASVYRQHKDDWEGVNIRKESEPEISPPARPNTPPVTSPKTTSVMQSVAKSIGNDHEEKGNRSAAKKKAAEIIARVREEKRKEEGIYTTGDKRLPGIKQNNTVNNYWSKTSQQTKEGVVSQQKSTVRIAVKDFVVRRSVFRCRKENHVLQNIDAVVMIIDSYGHLKEMKVPAGYCKSCNMYFIMESNYQYLKLKGTLVCRVSDEKSYLSGNTYMNGMRLAQESVLMQYGYNVSKGSNLTTASRRKLLEILVDNQVMTRSEIISYLDFFIRQRKTRKQYEDAIDKWSSDREYISHYKTGDYRQVRIGGISRR